MKEEIKIPKEWLKRLMDMRDIYMNSQGEKKYAALNLLLGYLSSIEFILK